MKLSEISNSAVWGSAATNHNKLHAFPSGLGLPAACNSRIYTAGPLQLARDPQYGNGVANYCGRCVGHLTTRAAHANC